jgi:signal transduction histidine kinase
MGDVGLELWPLAATMAVAVVGRWRATRRRAVLNRALHELRRPLQAMVLAGSRRPGGGSGPGPLELALAALDDLDAAINGTEMSPARRPVSARPLVESSVARWRAFATGRDASIELVWRAGAAVVIADPARLAQALDNLLANAVEHGEGGILVEGRRSAVGLSVRVTSARRSQPGRAGDPRRGHGLAVVERFATAHLGRFRVRAMGDRVLAELELPLARAPLPVVPIEWAPGRRRAAGRRAAEPTAA